ncbi:thymidine kinase [Candidatus Uhrbacteria bacterium]|nr:thymidine kinase [Candidatus Uhrbacteria bacterium]
MPHHGQIEVIVGCMFSGKSEELIRRLKRLAIAKKRVIVFKPSLDTRWNRGAEMVSRNGMAFDAHPIFRSSEMIEKSASYDVIGIDEAHFFDESIFAVAQELRESGKHVIVSGLDMDFRGEPFGQIPLLMAVADAVLKLDAVCMLCGGRATMTQRLIDWKPAPYESEQILVGDEEYQARCRSCHAVLRNK